MEADEINALVQREIEEFRYVHPARTIGEPWSVERVASEVVLLRSSLIQPQLCTVEFGFRGSERQAWLVTRSLENGYVVVFDPVARSFGLAVRGKTGHPQTVGVWGRLVDTFMAR